MTSHITYQCADHSVSELLIAKAVKPYVPYTGYSLVVRLSDCSLQQVYTHFSSS